ncbi:hypothetical protein [Alkaliphilus peptidifermentans]|uniref:Core-binding (CB) domain-containing protein n=1 Tax=Alkaliphilus peptidifermentans DSM 18978 TaxID=1120976 RepID=A0A1G5LBQ5_9FIRM|nr:hypothetical protein [Alkaliphilus peptidifermentans]SCZ10302.1 hypothetical protein SAMN03080606_04274 [Alkaliphilus peptidifermentans DSM 18978]
MTKSNFKAYLKKQGQSIGKYYPKGKALGLNAINDIIMWANRVERLFDLNLDVIAQGSKETQELLKKINHSNLVSDKQKRNYSGAVRAYFEFINGHVLPSEQ